MSNAKAKRPYFTEHYKAVLFDRIMDYMEEDYDYDELMYFMEKSQFDLDDAVKILKDITYSTDDLEDNINNAAKLYGYDSYGDYLERCREIDDGDD